MHEYSPVRYHSFLCDERETSLSLSYSYYNNRTQNVDVSRRTKPWRDGERDVRGVSLAVASI